MANIANLFRCLLGAIEHLVFRVIFSAIGKNPPIQNNLLDLLFEMVNDVQESRPLTAPTHNQRLHDMITLQRLSIIFVLLSTTAGCLGSSSEGGTTIPVEEAPVEALEPTETASLQLFPEDGPEFNEMYREETAAYTVIDIEALTLTVGDANATGRVLVGYGETDDGLVYFGYAGYEPNSLNGSRVDTGQIVYDSTYQVLEYVDVASNPTDHTFTRGEINVLADFTGNTITADDGLFVLEGTLSDVSQNFDGTVTWRGIEGEIDGQISDERLLSAFQGSDDDTVFAGILSGSPQQ